MSPQDFIAKWRRSNLRERSAYQQHFCDLCELLGQPKPAEADPDGAFYTFDRGVRKTTGEKGFADVWMRGHFGWEYKGKHKDLKEAYQQLLLYRVQKKGSELFSKSKKVSHLRATTENSSDPFFCGAIGTVRWPRLVPKDADCAESLKKRTLTNLYNERPTWLDLAHKKLDAAVFAAYGWDPGISDDDLLGRLLELNLARAGR